MNIRTKTQPKGFSLIETVIAIGVLAVLLTGFMVVFAPAASGIRKSLNSQDAARMVATLEQELVSLRGDTQAGTYATGFHKAFDYIRKSQAGSGGGSVEDALLIYKYRASLTTIREDGTPAPVPMVKDQIPGVNYVVQNMVRRKSETAFLEDLAATEGPVYLVKCTQLIESATATELLLGTPGQIANSSAPAAAIDQADAYNAAVLTFVADFYPVPGKAAAYYSSPAFTQLFTVAKKPLFSRNLAVRR